MGFSESYFNFVNSAVVLVGLAILGYAGYLLSEYDDLVQGVGTYTVMLPLILGGALLIVGGIGCLGAKKEIKILMFVYFVIATIALIVVLGTGAALLAIGGYLEDVKQGDAIENDIMGYITDFQISLFNGCCADQAGISPVTELCDENTTSYCITDEDFVNDFDDVFGEETCDFLETVEINDVPIVGNFTTDPTTCGGGDIESFIDSITAYIEENINLFGGINIAVSVLLLLLVISSCCLICKPKEDKEKQNQVQANQMAY